MYAYHPLSEVDRLSNPELNFPISFAYGDKDFLGTKGAEIICNSNKYRTTGESQIFIIPNSGHPIHTDNPEALVRAIKGAFFGTIQHVFELKDRFHFERPETPPIIQNSSDDNRSHQTADGLAANGYVNANKSDNGSQSQFSHQEIQSDSQQQNDEEEDDDEEEEEEEDY